MILKPDNPGQMFFTSRDEMISEEPLVRVVEEVVNRLDLSSLYACWSEKGRSFYDPAMMLKILFFAYCDGERHSRQIAKKIRYDIRFQYFTGSLRPDFRTICRFRNIDADLLASYFVQIVNICEQAGLLDISMLSIDGTKIKASAARKRTLRRKDLDRLFEKYKKLLSEDAAIDLEDIGDDEGNEKASDSGHESIDRNDLKRRVGEALERLEGGEKEVNLTDSDARFMKTSDGGIRPGYNGQIAVDKNQIIVAADISARANDVDNFKGMVEQSKKNVSSKIGKYLVDGGYFSRNNLKYIVEKGLDVYMPTGSGHSESGGKFGGGDFIYDKETDSYRCPAGERLPYKNSRKQGDIAVKIYRSSSAKCRSCKLKFKCTTTKRRELNISEVWPHEQKMKEKLNSETGSEIYSRRKVMVEPVFGNMKFNMGFGRFVLRGLGKVRAEFLLMCIAHNLKKISKVWAKPRLMVALKSIVVEKMDLILYILRKLSLLSAIKALRTEFAQ
ncbi:MAG: IS1182 family transposase [Deltaproteobacteria bacterium]|nr:IS1182 family transposase [Deltaproteobacteria bacterium]